MELSVLQSLGLSPNEAKLYHALITYGGSAISTVATRSKVHRRNAYDAMQRLTEKGLVSEIFSRGETLYEAVEPTKLLELIQDKERELAKVLPGLTALYAERRAPQQAYIYKGLEGMKNYLREALRVGEDIYSFAAKGGWFDPRLATFVQWFLKEAKKKKMKYFHIFDYEVEKDLPIVPESVELPYKFLPKKYSTNSTIDIFGDHVVTFTGLNLGKLEDDVTIFVMVSPRLAEGYRTWWKLIWDLLPEHSSNKGHKI